jgi:mannosyltransferase
VFFDEAYVAWLAAHPWKDLLPLLRNVEYHPPLYYIVMKAWIAVAGAREAALRTPSAVFGSLSVALTYVLVRRVASERIGVISALFVAVSPFEIMAGQYGKMYTLLEVLAVGSTLVLTLAASRGGPRWWGIYAAVAAAMLYTHYLGIFVLAAHGTWVLCRRRTCLTAWFAAMLATAVLYAPWVPSLWVQLGHARASEGWVGVPPLPSLLALGSLFAFGGSLLGAPGFIYSNTSLSPEALLALLFPFLGVLAWGVYAARRDPDALLLLGLPPFVAVVGPLLLSAMKPLFIPRWFSFVYPFCAAFLAWGVADIAGRAGRYRRAAAALVAAILVGFGLPVLDRLYFDSMFRDQWRAASHIVAERFQAGDIILYGDPQNELIFLYYLGSRYPGMVLAAGNLYFSGALPGPWMEEAVFQAPMPFATLAKRYRRIWVVVAPPFTNEMLVRTLKDMGESAALIGEIQFGQDRRDPVPVYPLVYLFATEGVSP